MVYSKGQLILKANSKLCLWTKKQRKYFCISALAKKKVAKSRKYKMNIWYVYTTFTLKFAFEINWPLEKTINSKKNLL